MQDGKNGASDSPALAELRARLNDALAGSRTVDGKNLHILSGLSRTTVWEALKTGEPVPSAKTVAALARTLKLPAKELLALRRDAAEGGHRPALGRPILEWDPHALEVHPAGPGALLPGPGAAGVLPGYVERAHDRVLREVVRDAAGGRSRMLLLVGESSTGKTRACWEAVQPLAAEGWRLWHPFDPTRAEAALDDLHRVGPRTVVWLNEAQHYLGDREAGERIAAALHTLLTAPERGPLLVLGTLWHEYADQYTALPTPGRDPHSRVRELLAGRTLSIPSSFDVQALATAAAKADDGDQLLADALTRVSVHGRLAQDLAGAPELLKRYERATPAAAAVLEAAMDARRLGVGPHLPQALLTDAAADYLTDTEYDQLTDDWVEQVFAELALLVHGKQAPLRRTTPRPQRRPPTPFPAGNGPAPATVGPVYRLADYLEQHGRTSRRHLCPPASFWHAAHIRLTNPDDLGNLTQAAKNRHRLQWAHFLRHRAAERGRADALSHLAVMREEAGDRDSAETLARQAAEHGDTYALERLAVMREEAGDRDSAEVLARQAAEHGNTHALYRLAEMQVEAGDRDDAQALFRQAADHGNTHALYRLAEMQVEAGDRDDAQALFRQAADHGNSDALYRLAEMREEAGDRGGAEALARQAAEHGSTHALERLAAMREEAGDRDDAQALFRQAADHGDTYALYRLAEMREEAGDRGGAEALAREAAEHGSTDALERLAEMREEAGDRDSAQALFAPEHGNTVILERLSAMREEAGDRDSAETLARQAAEHGDTYALERLAAMRAEAGDRDSAQALFRQAGEHGGTYALYRLAEMREEAGDRDDAQALAGEAAEHGNTHALYCLAEMREEAGDRDSAQALARQGVDYGNNTLHEPVAGEGLLTRLWPYGLDPDGTPTSLWRASVSLEQSRHIPPGTS